MDRLGSSDQRRWAGYAFIAAAAIAMALAFGRGEHRSGGIIAVRERRPMPAVEMRQLDGGLWRLAERRGQVVAINYWASWCAPCWEETPGLVRMSADMAPAGLAVVGVAMDEGSPQHVTESVRRFIQTFHVNYPIVLPTPMSQMAYGMEGLPTTVLVDRRGRVAKIYVGAARETDLRADIGTLLRESVAGP